MCVRFTALTNFYLSSRFINTLQSSDFGVAEVIILFRIFYYLFCYALFYPHEFVRTFILHSGMLLHTSFILNYVFLMLPVLNVFS